MFPPAFVEKEVQSAVAVDVASSHTVVEMVPGAFWSNGVKFPGSGWSLPVWCDPAPLFFPKAEYFGFAVSVHVDKGWGFSLDAFEDEVFLPEAGFVFGILVPESLMLVDTATNEDVLPAVLVEVVDEGEHAVGGTRFFGVCDSGVELVFSLEERAFVPIRAGHDIFVAVIVEVSGVDTIAEVVFGKDLFFESGRFFSGEGESDWEEEGSKVEEMHPF